MEQFVIEGGVPLSGTVKPGGNKNAVLKMLPACLLTDEPITLTNVPDILDVRVTIDIMRNLGCEIEWLAPDVLRVHAKELRSNRLDEHLATRIRTSFVFAGPLLARMGGICVPAPGGDVIGERRLDTHVHALRKLGAEIHFERGVFVISAPKLVGTSILLSEASVTATDNALLASVLAKGTTIINNAASEPHVQNLCEMLIAMGAIIDGVGSNRLTVQGVEKLHGCETTVGADYIESVSWVAASVLTGGQIRVTQADPHVLGMVELVFARLGVSWTVEGNDLLVPSSHRLTIEPDLGGRIPVIKAQPWPAFPADLMSIALVIATQSKGAVMFHDWMFESRLFFTDKLVQMGARITLCDPHRVLVQGPTALKPVSLVTSPDIRAGMAILCAALAAPGTTRIANVRQIDRGYERVEQKLRALGARIERVDVDVHETSELRAVMP